MDGGPNNVLRPRKQSNQYWEIEKKESRPQALATNKKMPLVKRPPGRSPLSIQRPQPSLSQLPLLLQERGKVVHGGERVWVIRAEVRFAPCKSSAVQGLRLVSWDDGVGGVGPRPGSACEYYVTMWERKKDEQWPCVWTDEKDVKYNCTM